VRSVAAEPAGVGEVRLVRTFRVGGDGGLYAVHSRHRWEPGWNTAQCGKGRDHTAPGEECGCGFYAYAHPIYTRRQPPASQVLAVVGAQGAMEVGTRGARVGQARVEAIWFGPKVGDNLADRVQQRYPAAVIYRDRAAMLAEVPLTALDGFRAARFSERWRWFGRLCLGVLLAVSALVGALGGSAVTGEGSALWIAVVLSALAVALVAVVCRAQIVTLAALSAVAWLVTETSTSSLAAVYRALVVLVLVWVLGSWWWTGRIGADPAESSLDVVVRRVRRSLPGA
jgi:hypothetical protein